MIYGAKGAPLLSDEYLEYFGKKPGPFVVMSRGRRKVSEYLELDFGNRGPELSRGSFRLNDPDGAVARIRERESGYAVVQEGLVATYPTRKLLDRFARRYGELVDPRLADSVFPETSEKIRDAVELSDPDEEISPAVAACFPAADEAGAKRLVKRFTDDAVPLGYYMTSYEIDRKTLSPDLLVRLQFEAKYSDLKVRLTNVLYHVSPLKYLGKILKNGLVPRSSSEEFGYSERVYFFNECPAETVFEYGAFKAGRAGDDGFCVFRIPKKKLLADPLFANGKTAFWLDPAFSLSGTGTDQTAVLTYGNVPLRLFEDEYLVARTRDGEVVSVGRKVLPGRGGAA